MGMKIGINATIVDPLSSGLGIYTINIVRELARLHLDIAVYTSASDFFKEDGVEVHEVTGAVRASRGFRGHLTRLLWSQTDLPRQLRNANVSVLLSPTPLEGVLRSPVPQVLVVHDILPIRFPGRYPRQRHYFRYVFPRLLRNAVRVVAVSKTTREEILNTFRVDPEKIAVIYNGCDHERFNLNSQQGGSLSKGVKEPFFLYVGNLFPHKNIQRLLTAFASISKRIKHQLVVVGSKDPRYYPTLRQMAISLGIKDRVCFLDYVQSAQLPNLYRHAHWLILPSLFEGFGMPPIEAMACGTPVILSRTPALEETVGDAGVYFDPTDCSDMSEKILNACLNENQRHEARRKGLERAAQYSWERTARQLLQVLNQANEMSRE